MALYEGDGDSVLARKFWDNEYAKGYIYGKHPSETAIKTAKLLLSRGLTGNKIKVLEIGGGYGRNSLYFNELLGINATVVDFSGEAIILGQKLAAESRGKACFIHSDARVLDRIMPPSSYDIIFHNFCCHLLPEKDRAKIYEKAKYALKPKGHIIGSYLSTKDHECPKGKTGCCNMTKVIRGKPQHFFTEREIADELGKYFRVLKIEDCSDLEKIIDEVRNTQYYYVVGEKKCGNLET